jgi:hypothetical protein
MVNSLFTRLIPLILGWWSGLLAQAILRNVLFGAPLIASLNPMTGVAFVLFSFYMITDPATTPFKTRSQLAFGLAVAATYGALVCLHVVFGFFFALTLVSGGRGLIPHIARLSRTAFGARVPAPSPAAAIQKPVST